jgi:Domain of unknown function (DUF4861)
MSCDRATEGTSTTASVRLLSIVFLLCATTVVSIPSARAQQLLVWDDNPRARLYEVIELPLSDAKQHISDLENETAADAHTNEVLPTQIVNPPGEPEHALLLIAVHLPFSGKMTIVFVPKLESEPNRPLVFGREAPERKDDFAWENQYTAYRVYGPALEATGEITSGIDVWSKRVPNLVIDSFYKHDAEGARTHNPALSYHVDDGVGLDSYLVGKTRGCGGTGVLRADKVWVSKNYTHLKLIANGPVRFEFEMTYAPWSANGIEVTETKRITLDAGSRLNRIRSTFTFSGVETIDAAAGLAVHDGAVVRQLENGRVISVWDTPQEASAGRIATGMIRLNHDLHPVVPLAPNTLMIFPVHSGDSFTYLAGSGWSKADMPTQEAWDGFLTETLYELDNPLKTRWSKGGFSLHKKD